MKKLAIAMASIFTVIAPVAHAAYDRNGNGYNEGNYQAPVYTPSPRERQEFARVIESRPVYEASNRREECWNPRAGHYEERRETHDSNVNGTVAGAVVGGVVGHQFDSGAGATVGGALLGGLIGNQVEQAARQRPRRTISTTRAAAWSARPVATCRATTCATRTGGANTPRAWITSRRAVSSWAATSATTAQPFN